jgi:hypothetical protein
MIYNVIGKDHLLTGPAAPELIFAGFQADGSAPYIEMAVVNQGAAAGIQVQPIPVL